MKNLCILYLCLLSIGCTEQINADLIKERLPPSEINFTNEFSLQLKDSLQIPLPNEIPPYFEFADFLSGDSLYYFSYSKNNIAKVNLLDKTISPISIPENLITKKIKSIYPINEDSILVTQEQPSMLFLITKDSTNSFQLPKINFRTSNEDFYSMSRSLSVGQANFILDYRNLFYDSKTKNVHIGLQPYDAYDQPGFEDSGRIAIFNLRLKKWELVYAPPEGMMKFRGDKTYSFQMSSKKMLLKNDTVFVSYTNDHNVYYYTDGKYLGKFPHISNNSKKLFLPLDKKRLEDPEEIKQYAGAAPKYSGFHYHESVKLYSRIYFDQQEPLNENGTYKPAHLFRNVYAIFLDQEFNHVGEFKFPFGGLEFLGAKPLSDGYAVFSTTYNDRDTMDSTFKLKYIYKIIPTTEIKRN